MAERIGHHLGYNIFFCIDDRQIYYFTTNIFLCFV